jgi:putative ABC transport system permease protein
VAWSHALTVALRGLRSRAVLTFGTVLLATIGIAGAVVGPAYLRAATNSLLVDRLDAAPISQTGLSWEYHPATGQPAAGVLDQAETVGDSRAPEGFAPATVGLVTARFEVPMSGYDSPAEVVLRTLADGCESLLVSGRCPARPYEVLVARVDLERGRGDLDVGDRVPLPGPDSPSAVVVGSYRLEPGVAWFDPSRFVSAPAVPSDTPGSPDDRAYAPAPLITPEGTFDALPPSLWWADVDRPLAIDPALTPADADRLAELADAERQRGGVQVEGGTLGPARWNTLRSVVDEVEAERDTARNTVLPAALSLSLVALLLLFRLLGESADLRRPEFALLSLRGWSRRRMWAFGLTEAAVVLLAAAPLGVLLGWQSTKLIASAWLRPGLPVELTAGSIVGAVAVLVVGVGAASLALVHVMREQLREQLEATNRPRALGRVELAVQATIVLAAVVGGYVVASRDGRGSPGLTDLLLPVVLAMAIGLVAGHLTVLWARSLTRRTRSRPALAPYLSSRRLARRREGTLVVLPLAVALGVGVFAMGVDLAAASWRDSVAASRVGADLAYSSDLSADRTMGLTRQLDPDGEWLMAGTVVRNLEGPQIVALDTTRLASVGTWPSDWGVGSDAAAVAELLVPQRQPPRIVGRNLALEVDNAVRSDGSLHLVARLRDATGELRYVTGSEVPRTAGRVLVRVPCANGCELVGLNLGGVASTPKPMHGELIVTSASVDGSPVDAALDDPDAWRPVRPYTGDDDRSVVEVSADSAGLHLRVDTGNGYDTAQITSTDAPDVRPIVATSDVALPAAPDLDDAQLLLGPAETDWDDADLPVRVVGTSEAVPVLGRSGVLVDLTAYTREDYSERVLASTQAYVFARAGLPADMVEALAAAGVDVDSPLRLDEERAELGHDAYALSIRLYVVVAGALLLLALAGVIAHLVVGMPGRRRDAASLRVVGVSKRTVLRAGLVDLAITLGVAAVAGVVAGVVAQRIILGQIRLGTADDRSPDISGDVDLLTLGMYVGATTVVLLAVSATVATASVRRARGAELREAAR